MAGLTTLGAVVWAKIPALKGQVSADTTSCVCVPCLTGSPSPGGAGPSASRLIRLPLPRARSAQGPLARGIPSPRLFIEFLDKEGGSLREWEVSRW